MDRRRFRLTSLAGALAAPLAPRAQQAVRTARVGYLSTGDRPTGDRLSPLGEVFREALREHG
jgi:hypothetical protein